MKLHSASHSVPLMSRAFGRTERGQQAAIAGLTALSLHEVRLLRMFNGLTPATRLAALMRNPEPLVSDTVIRLLALGLIEAC